MKAKHAFACDITMLGPFFTTRFRYFDMEMLYAEAVVRRCSVNKVFLEISQNSQENTCARVSFLIKLQALQLY